MRPGTWLPRYLSVAAAATLISSSQYTASWWLVALCSYAGLHFAATPEYRAAMKIDGGLTPGPLRVSRERCHLCVCGVRGDIGAGVLFVGLICKQKEKGSSAAAGTESQIWTCVFFLV